jgi:prepilin-type N-terminal cleavage/methylation domain-containing protein
VKRRGFTLVELLMVMVILGLLSGIALLRYIDIRNSARAASLAGDFRNVQVAALNYYADNETWPPESGPGVVPTGLAKYLGAPLNGSFDRGLYLLDYENVDMGGGGPIIGISVTTSDPKLMAKLTQTLSTQAPYFMWGNKLTYLISGPGGVF